MGAYKGYKKQDLRKKPLAHQRIVYKRILTLQTEDGIYDLEKRKILKHNEQWSIALEKARQYINQFIKEENRVFWKVYNNKKIYKYNITLFFFFV